MYSYFKDIYRDKRVIVTGNTGFKGSWLSLWLQSLGAEVLGIALESEYENDHFQAARLNKRMDCRYIDIRDYPKIWETIEEFKPDFIFHLAAQALVGIAFEEPQKTFETNMVGTLNLLEALRNYSKPCVGVMITSDKCYRNVEQIWGYREADILGGDDPYSASKGSAELIINSYIESFFKNSDKSVASARAGNVVGGGDRSKYRLVPDCFRALIENQPIVIRNPESTRPWQYVLEPLSGYLQLGMRLLSGDSDFCTGWNFGPHMGETKTVREVVEEIIRCWGEGEIQIEREEQFYESSLLQLDCTKARVKLKWESTLTLEECIRLTTDWYRCNYEDPKADMHSFGLEQIQEYQKLAIIKGRSWTHTTN